MSSNLYNTGERWELPLYPFNYNKKAENPVKSRFSAIYLMFLSGFEPLAFRLGGGRSILLSYRNPCINLHFLTDCATASAAQSVYYYIHNFLFRQDKSYISSRDSLKFTVPCIQICPLNLRPTSGVPTRSFLAIPTWNIKSLHSTVKS